MWKRQTVADLKETYGKGEHTIRRILDRTLIRKSVNPKTQTVVCVFDASHLGEETLLVARAPALRANLGWAWITSETKEAYAGLRMFVEDKGFTLTGAVLDGRTGIPRVFEDIPVQICQFHQMQIVRRKLTLRRVSARENIYPRHEALELYSSESALCPCQFEKESALPFYIP